MAQNRIRQSFAGELERSILTWRFSPLRTYLLLGHYTDVTHTAFDRTVTGCSRLGLRLAPRASGLRSQVWRILESIFNPRASPAGPSAALGRRWTRMNEFSHKATQTVPICQAPASTRKTKTQPVNKGRAVEGVGGVELHTKFFKEKVRKSISEEGAIQSESFTRTPRRNELFRSATSKPA